MIRKPRFYFSFHSPFSWMASHQLERRLPDSHDVLEYIPLFEPDAQTTASIAERGIDMHYTAMSKAKHLYILQDTKRLSARIGLPMKWPIDVDPWWVLPHHAYLAARRLGHGRELYWALSSARWERGENICEVDVVRRIADSIGLDGDALAMAPANPEIRAEGMDCLEKAYLDDIFGMPYFKLGPHRFWGLDRLDDFLSAYERSKERDRGRNKDTGKDLGQDMSDAAAADKKAKILLDNGILPNRPAPLDPSLVPDLDADPAAGLPTELFSLVGSYDRDSAGGCG